MLDIPSISALVAAVGVIVGVVLAILELRNITKTRQMELIMSIYSLFTTRGYMEAWEKIRTREFKDYDGYVKKRRAQTCGFKAERTFRHTICYQPEFL